VSSRYRRVHLDGSTASTDSRSCGVAVDNPLDAAFTTTGRDRIELQNGARSCALHDVADVRLTRELLVPGPRPRVFQSPNRNARAVLRRKLDTFHSRPCPEVIGLVLPVLVASCSATWCRRWNNHRPFTEVHTRGVALSWMSPVGGMPSSSSSAGLVHRVGRRRNGAGSRACRRGAGSSQLSGKCARSSSRTDARPAFVLSSPSCSGRRRHH